MRSWPQVCDAEARPSPANSVARRTVGPGLEPAGPVSAGELIPRPAPLDRQQQPVQQAEDGRDRARGDAQVARHLRRSGAPARGPFCARPGSRPRLGRAPAMPSPWPAAPRRRQSARPSVRSAARRSAGSRHGRLFRDVERGCRVDGRGRGRGGSLPPAPAGRLRRGLVRGSSAAEHAVVVEGAVRTDPGAAADPVIAADDDGVVRRVEVQSHIAMSVVWYVDVEDPWQVRTEGVQP